MSTTPESSEPSAGSAPATSRPPTMKASADTRTVDEKVLDALRSVFDPEIPINIYDLGLIYNVEVDAESKHASITMTLTTPACPVAGTLPGEVRARVEQLDEIDTADVDLVWDPPWTRDKLTEEAKLQLGLL